MRRLSRLLWAGGLAAAVCVSLATGTAGAAADRKALARAERTLRAGDFEEAERLYRALLAKDDRDVAARLGLSHALLKQRKHADAFDHAARAIALDPLSARAHSLLGTALLGVGDFRLSVEEFRTAISLREDDSMAVAGLAMVDFYENRLSASVNGLRRAVFIDPHEPDYLYSLGQVAARFERYAEAATAYEQFLRIAPRTDADRRARIQGLIDFLRYLGKQSNLTATAGPGAVEIPFDLVNNRPIIEVRVNGAKEPLRFVVDTGAGMCVISTEAAQRLGLRPVARGGMARAVGGEGRFEIVYGFLQTLHIGQARIDRVPVYIRQFFNDKDPVDGYIGLSVLGKYLTTVDYAARTMTLRRDETARAALPAPSAGAFELPIRTTSSGFWSGEVQLEGVQKPANFIIDTGASVTVVSEALAAREGLDRFAQNQLIKVYGAAGLSENIRTLTLPSLSLTPTHVRQHVYAAILDMDALNETAGFEQTGIVGGNILRYYRVTFDFARARVRLEPIRSGAPDAAPPAAATPVVSSQP